MENPTPELVTMRCPCSRPNPCCSQVVSSPKGLISILFWECQDFTDEDLDQELDSLRKIMSYVPEDGDD